MGGGAGGGDELQPATVRGHLLGQLVEQLDPGAGQMVHAAEVDDQRERPAAAGFLETSVQFGDGAQIDRSVHHHLRPAGFDDLDAEVLLAGRDGGPRTRAVRPDRGQAAQRAVHENRGAGGAVVDLHGVHAAADQCQSAPSDARMGRWDGPPSRVRDGHADPSDGVEHPLDPHRSRVVGVGVLDDVADRLEHGEPDGEHVVVAAAQ
ncbi:hypothetical protein WBK50_13120 [Pseudonocardia sp. T1-2H]|uniref:hypothetical protein n=1 Tax=Pseudonocardia sp. T1-2H TaxID=3128899 RepID=UPI003101191F